MYANRPGLPGLLPGIEEGKAVRMQRVGSEDEAAIATRANGLSPTDTDTDTDTAKAASR
jgi:hypothetical protein